MKIFRMTMTCLFLSGVIACRNQPNLEKTGYYSYIQLEGGTNFGLLTQMLSQKYEDSLSSQMVDYLTLLKEMKQGLIVKYMGGVKADTFLLVDPIPVVDMHVFLKNFNFNKRTLELYGNLERKKKYRDLTLLMKTAFLSENAVLNENNIKNLSPVEVDNVLTIVGNRIVIHLINEEKKRSKIVN